MGGELGEEEVTPPPTYEEIFWDALPWYLSVGMSAEEFWQGDPKLAESYREAYKLKKERKNQELWLQGLYFLKALGCVLHGSEESPYPDEPLALTEADREAQVERERRNADAGFEASMMSFAANVNRKFANKGEVSYG